MSFTKVLMQDNFLNKNECQELINFYTSNSQSHKRYGGTYLLPLRQSSHKKLVKKINKLSLMLNNSVIDWFQIVKWGASHPGKNLHFDTTVSKTVLSSIIYLNNDFEGGHTFFEDGTAFAPAMGRIIFFDGKHYHHGVSEIKNKDRYTVASWFKL
jgi:hypothetical protein|tara:strand:- start:204 stop:668 length:465 start_codon:yes stop_codon:yes gene_type:complete